jgi:hypothetical protein
VVLRVYLTLNKHIVSIHSFEMWQEIYRFGHFHTTWEEPWIFESILYKLNDSRQEATQSSSIYSSIDIKMSIRKFFFKIGLVRIICLQKCYLSELLFIALVCFSYNRSSCFQIVTWFRPSFGYPIPLGGKLAHFLT